MSDLNIHSTDGGEFINIDSDKDIHVHAVNDENIFIEHDVTELVNGKQTATIIGDHSTTVQKGNLQLDVQAGTLTEHVAGDVDKTYDGHKHEHVAKDWVHLTNGFKHENILGASSKSIEGLYSNVVMGGYNQIISPVKHETILGFDIKTGKTKKIDLVGTEWNYKSPITNFKTPIFNLKSDHRFTLASKDTRFTVSPDKIILKCGDSSLELDKDGTITIHGKKLVITGDDSATTTTNHMTLKADSHTFNVGTAAQFTG